MPYLVQICWKLASFGEQRTDSSALYVLDDNKSSKKQDEWKKRKLLLNGQFNVQDDDTDITKSVPKMWLLQLQSFYGSLDSVQDYPGKPVPQK